MPEFRATGGSTALNLVARRKAFARLHETGSFVIPNPWDVGSARYLAHLGFAALATTSAGLAFSLGRPDSVTSVSREDVLAHVASLVAATELPVNADFQSGYAKDPDGVGESVRLCVATGVAGLSIEDATGERDRPLYPLAVAVERLRAARAAIDATGTGVLLTARAESFLVGHASPLEDVLERLVAYAAAGADVLFAPGMKTREEILAVVRAVAPRPVNVLMSHNLGFSVADVAELGVRRISTGSALARTAWGGFMRAAKGIAEKGSFAALSDAASFAELNQIFSD